MKKNVAIIAIAVIASVMAIIFGVRLNAEKVMESEHETVETTVSAYKKYEDAIREDFPKLLSEASNGTYSTISQRFDWHEDQSITWTIVAYDHELEAEEVEVVEIPGPTHLVLYQAEISEQLG